VNDAPTFETALAELEQILRALEDGTTTLEDGLARYERGVALLKQCYTQLQSAEQRIAVLTNVDAEGKPVLQSFGHASAAEPPETPRRTTRPKLKGNDGLY
jgi:exodeoxyribonuclease VII small subunit